MPGKLSHHGVLLALLFVGFVGWGGASGANTVKPALATISTKVNAPAKTQPAAVPSAATVKPSAGQNTGTATITPDTSPAKDSTVSKGRIIIDCNSKNDLMSQTSRAVQSFFATNCRNQNPKLIAVYDLDRGFLTTLGGNLTTSSTANPQNILFNFLRANVGLFGVSDPVSQLQFSADSSHLDLPQKAIKYTQVFRRSPVYGGAVSGTVDASGALRTVISNFKPDIYNGMNSPSPASTSTRFSAQNVKDIVARDLKLTPLESLPPEKINKKMKEKIDALVPVLVYVPVNNQWILAWKYYAFIWERNLQAKEPKQQFKLAAYEYWIDAQSGNILQKGNAAKYCDNDVGRVYTPMEQLVWNDNKRFPLNTCKGWEIAANRHLHRDIWYLEDHTQSGVIETYDIDGVSETLAAMGYYSVALSGGWPSETPTDRNNNFRVDVASESGTVHWAAQLFRDFMNSLGRDQVHGDWDIDLGARFTEGDFSFSLPPIHTAVITLDMSGISTVAHELMHMVTYWETPGVFSLYDDQSVDENLSELFSTFTIKKKSPYLSLLPTPWCTGFDGGSVDGNAPLNNFVSHAKVLADNNAFNSTILINFEHLLSYTPWEYQNFDSFYCFYSTPLGLVHKSLLPPIVPHNLLPPHKPEVYKRTAASMKAAVLLDVGGNLYKYVPGKYWDDLRIKSSTDSAFLSAVADTDAIAQIHVDPIGMEDLIQISYHTVTHSLDSGMMFEDNAARQVASCSAMGMDDKKCCNVKNAYASVGYGESDDWDCDGVPNEQDQCQYHDDADTSWIDKHPLFCGRQRRNCNPPTQPPYLSINPANYTYEDENSQATVRIELDPFADYRNVQFDALAEGCLKKSVPCTLGNENGDASGVLRCSFADCYPDDEVPLQSHFIIRATKFGRLLSWSGVDPYDVSSGTTFQKIRYISHHDPRAFSPSCPGDAIQARTYSVEPAVIISIEDNFGNFNTLTMSNGGLGGSNYANETNTRVQNSPNLGDTLEITVHARDPNNLPITYQLDFLHSSAWQPPALPPQISSDNSVSFSIPLRAPYNNGNGTFDAYDGYGCFVARISNMDGVGYAADQSYDDEAQLCYLIH